MKNIIKYIFAIAIITFSFQACDYIEEPYERNANGGNGGDTLAKRKVLLEDYTGHKCVNCPGAAVTAHDLKEQYEDQLIIIAVHAGYFAEPSSSGLYTTDFTTETGDELDSYFGVSALGNPNGMVNRLGEGTGRVKLPDVWPSAIGQEISKPADALIEIDHTYNDQTRVVSTTLNIEFKNNLAGNYRISVFITEDDIDAPQMNNDPAIGPTPDIEDYVHMHVLRGSLNGTFGDQITDETIEAGAEYSVDLNDYTVSADWKDGDCSLVSFIFNSETFEIIQAEEVKL
jgi:hypothetical protein